MFLCLKAIRLKRAFFESQGEPFFVSAFSCQLRMLLARKVSPGNRKNEYYDEVKMKVF